MSQKFFFIPDTPHPLPMPVTGNPKSSLLQPGILFKAPDGAARPAGIGRSPSMHNQKRKLFFA